jgi:hypothetical protein
MKNNKEYIYKKHTYKIKKHAALIFTMSSARARMMWGINS